MTGMMNQKGTRTALTLTTAALTLTFALTACGSSSDEKSADKTDTTTTTTTELDAAETETTEAPESTDVAAYDLAVGDCLDLSTTASTGEVDTIPTVDCAVEHDGEVFAVSNLDSATLPDDVAEQASQLCYDAFEPYVGTSYEESSIYFSYVYPTSATGYLMGNDQIQCILEPETPVTGSLAGSGL